MIIYPAIDIKGGRCVRLTQGRADQETVYFADPAEPARLWRAAGAAWVHVVDLDGAFTGKPQNLDAVRRIAALGMKVQLGGGMRDAATVAEALAAGVERVVIGTRACEEPQFLAELVAKNGGARIAVGIDARNGRVATKGWVDTSEKLATDLARQVAALGVQTIIYTDISRDGMLEGPNIAAQRALLAEAPVRVIASGGVSSRSDVEALAKLGAEEPRLDGVIVGKALYEKRVDLADLIGITRG